MLKLCQSLITVFFLSRSIRCLRNIIHWNLITTFILRNVMWFLLQLIDHNIHETNEVGNTFQLFISVLACRFITFAFMMLGNDSWVKLHIESFHTAYYMKQDPEIKKWRSFFKSHLVFQSTFSTSLVSLVYFSFWKIIDIKKREGCDSENSFIVFTKNDSDKCFTQT